MKLFFRLILALAFVGKYAYSFGYEVGVEYSGVFTKPELYTNKVKDKLANEKVGYNYRNQLGLCVVLTNKIKNKSELKYGAEVGATLPNVWFKHAQESQDSEDVKFTFRTSQVLYFGGMFSWLYYFKKNFAIGPTLHIGGNYNKFHKEAKTHESGLSGTAKAHDDVLIPEQKIPAFNMYYLIGLESYLIFSKKFGLKTSIFLKNETDASFEKVNSQPDVYKLFKNKLNPEEEYSVSFKPSFNFRLALIRRL